MLTDVDIKKIFNANYRDRVIISQKDTKHCHSFIRNKLMLRYSFEEALLIVRDEIMHKIMAEKPLLITNALKELLVIREKIEKRDVEFFSKKSPSELLKNYLLFLNYLGIIAKNSKLYCRTRNFIIIANRYSDKKINEQHFIEECSIQLAKLEEQINIFTRSDPADMIIYCLRFDLKKNNFKKADFL